jgi:VIT1/CCC1 family predicted Fe2+/Mn2+ transporter
LLERVVQAITADRERWVRTMLREEYGLPASIRSAWRAASSTFAAFVACGLVPVLPFLIGMEQAFAAACLTTAVVFATIGAVKSLWSPRPWWRSGFETLVVGSGAAAVAYGIGAWLRTLVG